jgi:hypothetical protein
MENFIESGKGISLNTYRNLPAYLRKAVSLREIFSILNEKSRYMDTLTYSEKCFITADRIAGIAQRRLYKKDIYLSKVLIKQVLQAEEAYYQYLFRFYVD